MNTHKYHQGVVAQPLSRHGVQKLLVALLFAVGLLMGLAIFQSLPAQDAFACPPPTACGSTGGDNGNNNNQDYTGQGGKSSYTEDTSESVPANLVEVKCNNWSGRSSWQESSTCNLSRNSVRDAVKAKANLPAGGNYTVTLADSYLSCNAIGDKSAYSRDYMYFVTRKLQKKVSFAWMWDTLWNTGYRGGSFGIPGHNGGRYEHHSVNGVGVIWYNFNTSYTYTNNYSISIIGQSCNYPEETVGRQFYCFYGYGGDAYWSQNKSAIGSGGTHSLTRGSLAGDPAAPVWNGREDTAPSCSLTSERGGRAFVSVGVEPNNPSMGGATVDQGYAYYRLVPYYQQRQFTRLDYNIRGSDVMPDQTVKTKWSSNASNNSTPRLSRATWWAYSCLRGLEGPFGSSGSIPNRNEYFAIGNCPSIVPEWRCEIANPTTVGLSDAQRAALGGATSYSNQVTVMRNGEKVPLRFADVRIVDTSNGGRVDVTNGASGPNVRNVTSIQYRDQVKDGSTPFLGSDPNASNQLFKLWPSMTASSTDTWGSWKNNANSNASKAISFNWSSDSGSGTFVAQRQWRFTAQFRVQRVSGTIVGNTDGGGGASVTYTWVTDRQNCYERNADGTPNTSRMLTSSSNPVSVVRSVNNPDG